MLFAIRGKRQRGVNFQRGEFGKIIDNFCFVHADESQPRISPTVMRIPRMQGRPPRLPGSIVMILR
jgi:hypothetical protein